MRKKKSSWNKPLIYKVGIPLLIICAWFLSVYIYEDRHIAPKPIIQPSIEYQQTELSLGVTETLLVKGDYFIEQSRVSKTNRVSKASYFR